MNMPTETFLTTLYTIVDDWYQKHAPRSVAGRSGKKPIFSDSEVMTLSIAQHWLAIPDEREFLRFVQNNCLPLFPRLVSQGQFNRRARNLCWLIHRMRQHLVEQMGIAPTPCQLIDGTPVHLRHWRRFGKGHLLLPEAALGFCASKKETYYGFRLLALTTPDGIVVAWDLFAANTDERDCAQDLLDNSFRLSVLGDKVSVKFSTLNLRWRSNHRYYSERQFLDYMSDIRAEFDVRGERWKNLARVVLNLAYDVINQGEAKWGSK